MSENNDQDPIDAGVISFEIDTGMASFAGIEELEKWLQSERSTFAWLNRAAQHNTALSTLSGHYNSWFENLQKWIHRYPKENVDKQQNDQLAMELKPFVDTAFAQQHLCSSESAAALFVLEIVSERSAAIAGYALAFLTRHDVPFNSLSSIEGAFLAFSFREGLAKSAKAEALALEGLQKKWSEQFATLFEQQSERRILHDDEYSRLVKAFNVQADANVALQVEQGKLFEKLVAESRSELAAVTKTYDEKLALQQSVSYWTTKQDKHRNWAIASGLATLVLSVMAVTGVYFAGKEFLDVSVNEVKAWNIGLIAVLSGFGIWIVRLSTKIFVSNLHLRTDAHERVTMILTYLAMLREATGPAENERQLILQTLFRPTTDGFFRDDGPAGFLDAISDRLKSKTGP